MSEDNEIVATYKALKATRKLKSVQMDKYLCRGSGCTLAVVFQVPGRVVCWVPGYKNSSKLNDAVSVASARAKNTLDGDRHPRRGPHGHPTDRQADNAAWDGDQPHLRRQDCGDLGRLRLDANDAAARCRVLPRAIGGSQPHLGWRLRKGAERSAPPLVCCVWP